MSTTLMKLRIAGIAAFLLYILSAMFISPDSSGFYFTRARDILIVVAFVIFGILILLQLYGYFVKNHVQEEEVDQ